MSWTAPRTWVVGEIFTAALANTHIRDNLLETAPAKVTTKGDLVAAGAMNAIDRLGVGADATVLMADSAQTLGVKWGTVSGMKKITGTGYQWYVNSGSNVPYGAALSGTSSVDTFTAYVQLKSSTGEKDELTHIKVHVDTAAGYGQDALTQIASGGAGSETVITALAWGFGEGTSAYNHGLVIPLPIVVEVAASTRIAVRNKFSRTNGSTIVCSVNVGYVKASDISDFV